MTINETVDALLNIYGWTAYTLAKKAGIRQSTLTNTRRRCQSPSFHTLEALSVAFGLTLSDFFFFKESCEQSEKPEQFIHHLKTLTEDQRFQQLKFPHFGNNSPKR